MGRKTILMICPFNLKNQVERGTRDSNGTTLWQLVIITPLEIQEHLFSRTGKCHLVYCRKCNKWGCFSQCCPNIHEKKHFQNLNHVPYKGCNKSCLKWVGSVN